VRYQGLGLLDENDRHSDARACFASMVTLVGKEFWLNYGDGMCSPTNPSHPVPLQSHTGMSILAHPGGDCYAPALVVWPD
jgi:hypothetical protein